MSLITPNDIINIVEFHIEELFGIFNKINESDFFFSINDIASTSNYQYNFQIKDQFDDQDSVNTFMYHYCLKWGFGYQIYHNDKDPNNHNITCYKSFRCSSNNSYKPWKNI